MENDIQSRLIKTIKDSLTDLFAQGACPEDIYLDVTNNISFGDLSTNIALKLSKSLKKPPREIAVIISDNIRRCLDNAVLSGYVKDVKPEGAGFINFYLSDSYFHGYLKGLVAHGKASLRQDIGKGQEVLIEFVSANPTGSLSVAHARQAAVGDALANIFDFMGYKIKREYYLNDEGNQINILGNSVELRIKELRGEKVEFPENYYQGDYIYDIARKAIEDKPDPKGLGDYAAGYILAIIKKELSDFGVRFDYWSSQKELGKSGKIEGALSFLKEKGFLYEQDGAVWFKSTQFGDDKDRVVIKSDGSYTYLAPDIAYHLDKYKRGFKLLINLWGPDHHGYINRLKAAVCALGKEQDSLSVIIVQLASIFREGKPVQMSTRKGQYITLREVLDEVGPDAARFFFIMRRTSSHLSFDLEVAKKQTPENPVYYIQYAYARICSILRQEPGAKIKDADFRLLKEKEEIELIKKLWQFSYILNVCLNTQDPYMLTVYLQETAEFFHRFYDRHRVLGQEASLTCARLSLLKATQVVLDAGLELLGILRPEKM